MTNSKPVSPTGSYVMTLPVDICEDKDERVVSYWLPQNEVLLQASNYTRAEGQQVSANERLKTRIANENLSERMVVNISIPSCPDCAAMSGIDDQGCRWLYCYAVWPDLTILTTISGRPDELAKHGAWAFNGLKSITRAK